MYKCYAVVALLRFNINISCVIPFKIKAEIFYLRLDYLLK